MITVDFNRLSLQSGDRILDVGCGNGRHMGALCQFPGILTVGTDVAVEPLLGARLRMRQLDGLRRHGSGRWTLSAADGYHLPFKRHSFDLVICAEVMEHIVHQRRIIAQIDRVLKPRGTLVVSVPRYMPERLCWRLSPDYAGASGGHVRIYRKKELLDLFRGCGFDRWAIHYAHSLHTPYWWLKCAVGSNPRFQPLVDAYHRFLVWDIMQKPRLTQTLDRLLNPIWGKSLVVYFKKSGTPFSRAPAIPPASPPGAAA